MEDLIQRLDSWLQKNRPDYYQLLQPGLSSDEIAGFEDTLQVELAPEFKLFYKWKNGQSCTEPDFFYSARKYDFQKERYFVPDRPIADKGFIYNYVFMTRDNILGLHKMMNDALETMSHKALTNLLLQRWWNPKWIPFLDHVCLNRQCLDMSGIWDGKAGQVISVAGGNGDGGNQYITHESFYKWLETTLLLFENYEWIYDTEQGFHPKNLIGSIPPEINSGYPIQEPTLPNLLK